MTAKASPVQASAEDGQLAKGKWKIDLCYRPVEVRTRDWSNCENQGHQHGARGQRIGEQGNSDIAAR